MNRLGVVFASAFFFVSCGSHPQSADSETASLGTSSLVVKCERTTETETGLKVSDSLVFSVENKSVSLVRTLLKTSAAGKTLIKQTIEGSVNSVFDFNSVSKNSARLLLNATSLKSVEGSQETKKPLRSVFIQYSQGEVRVSDENNEVLFAAPKCLRLLRKSTRLRN